MSVSDEELTDAEASAMGPGVIRPKLVAPEGEGEDDTEAAADGPEGRSTETAEHENAAEHDTEAAPPMAREGDLQAAEHDNAIDPEDPRAALMQTLMGITTQVFVARAGEPMGGKRGNQVYDQTDARRDAMRIMVLTLNAEDVGREFADVARELGMPDIWPG